MPTIQKIRRNATEQIERIVAGATSCTRFDLANEFRGSELSADQVAELVSRHLLQWEHGALTTDGDGTYTLHVHSNLWYVFRSVPIRGRVRRPQTEGEKAEALRVALEAVELSAVPVKSRERCYRKERARLARELFRELGLRGISVTAPNYSMARVVDIRLPRLASGEQAEMRWKVSEILDRAFPNCDDRSDSMTDYFDACWSID